MLLGQSPELCPFLPHVQQSTLLGSFRVLAEKDPEEGLIGSRVAVVVFPVETFNACAFELKAVFSFLAMRSVEGDAPFFSAVL